MGYTILDTAANEFSLNKQKSLGSLSTLQQVNLKDKQSNLPRRRVIIPDRKQTPEGLQSQRKSNLLEEQAEGVISDKVVKRRKSIGDASESRLPAFAAALPREALRRRATFPRSTSLSALIGSRPTTPDSDVERLKVTVDLRTCELAAKYHLTPDVVRRIIRHIRAEVFTSSIDERQLDRIIRHILKVDRVDPNVVQSAYTAIKTADDEIEGFLEWYIDHDDITHAVNDVKDPCPVHGKKITEKMMSDLAARHAMSLVHMEKIRQRFVYYDTDNTNLINKRKFKEILHVVVKDRPTDVLKPKVVQKIWRDADKDGSGAIDFEEFVEWFLTYFDSHIDDPLEFKLKPSGAFLRFL